MLIVFFSSTYVNKYYELIYYNKFNIGVDYNIYKTAL